MLKADFHIHTKEDSYEPYIRYSAKDLIDKAKSLDFDVLAITHHMSVYFNDEIKSYARKKGILLIPGTEAMVEGNEVLILGKKKVKSHLSFKELKRLHDSGAVIIAPHPFYPKKECLGKKLIEKIDLFDAIEFCHFYSGWFTETFNRKAVRVAKKYGKSVVGTSDAHKMYQFNNTYTLVDSKKDVKSVFEAVRKGKVKLVTKPISLFTIIRHSYHMLSAKIIRKIFKNR